MTIWNRNLSLEQQVNNRVRHLEEMTQIADRVRSGNTDLTPLEKDVIDTYLDDDDIYGASARLIKYLRHAVMNTRRHMMGKAIKYYNLARIEENRLPSRDK